NKGTYGRVLVIAGSEDIYGAAYLAAEAALRTGCGLVKVVTHENNRNAILQMLPEALISTWSEAEKDQCVAGTEGSDCDPAKVLEDDIRWASVILIGPGLGQTDTSKHFVETVLRKATCPVILDADAINILSEHTDWLTETAGQRPLILTPHMLEMTRLTWETLHPERSALDALKKERVEIAKKIAMRYRATVVLKDACTVVVDGNTGSESIGGSEVQESADRRSKEKCRPGIYLNSSGNESMAKGGSGDVLTGMIAGLIAQGLSSEEAARLGVYVHGLTGDAARKKLGAYSVIARDLIDALSEVL
nr:NAD(P)H-hydrate dehydratase [Eubacterium sp.]